MQKTYFTLTSRVAERRAALEARGWIYVSSAIAPDREAPENETITALVMRKIVS